MNALNRRRFLIAAAATAATAAATTARAAGDALLSITVKGIEGGVALTEDDLLALPQHEIVTETDFTEGRTTFRGPLAKDVLALAGVSAATTLKMTAANDYAVDIPFADFDRYGVVMAMSVDGERLTRRSRGPIWLMYPIGEAAEADREAMNDKLIWQLVRVEVR